MYKHQPTPFTGLQKHSKALQSIFASPRSYGYALAQEMIRNIPRITFSPTMKELADV